MVRYARQLDLKLVEANDKPHVCEQFHVNIQVNLRSLSIFLWSPAHFLWILVSYLTNMSGPGPSTSMDVLLFHSMITTKGYLIRQRGYGRIQGQNF